jgi:hypothetical protein
VPRSLFLFAFLLPITAYSQPQADRALTGSTVEQRFPPPSGFVRDATPPGTFVSFLRRLPLLPERTPVHLYNGALKGHQGVHAAVIDISTGERDLQQCADAVMRLRAEYLYANGEQDAIAFNFTSGFRAEWKRWRQGERILVKGNTCTWTQRAAPDSSHAQLLKFLEQVFTYAGTLSLNKELRPATGDVAAGDVFIQGGSPGHAVVVMDVARDKAGRVAFLLAQSYMPAQDIHVLKRSDGQGTWYVQGEGDRLVTPEWTFRWEDRRRW